MFGVQGSEVIEIDIDKKLLLAKGFISKTR